MPTLGLLNLLKRRKMTLLQFIEENGIQTYGALVGRCNAIGVKPPSEEEYKNIAPAPLTSQQDGVIVIEPLPVIDEATGKIIDIDAPVIEPGVEIVTEQQNEPAGSASSDALDKKTKRKKKEASFI